MKIQFKDPLEPKLMAVTNQLLDLGKRNRLLNFKDTGLKSLRLMNKNIEEIFRAVKNYKDISFYDVDQAISLYHNELEDSLKVKDDVYQYENDKIMELIKPFLTGKELIGYKKGYGLTRVLKSLTKDHKTSLIEKGINPLYISFGFIHYIEEEIEYTAPLLLIPIEINAEEGFYKIRQYEDDIILNPTLKYYLSEVYKMELPDYNDEALSTYLETLKGVLDKSLTYEDGVALGIYSFYKMNMYNDLIANKELVLQNKNIRALLGELESIPEYDSRTETYPVVNCDSSQLDAIKAAANGKSFTLQGPPGSGKSQTITNMIATLLGHGKKILFVSEKIAALNVVYENLRRAKLSDFALELHSNKANKKEFIDSIYKAATLPRYELNLKTRFLESKYYNLRNTLNGYEEELHKVITGLDATLLDLYSIYLSIDENILDIRLNLDDVNLYTLDKISILLNEYTVYSQATGRDYKESGLYGLNLELVDDAVTLESDLDIAIEQINKLCEAKDLIIDSGVDLKVDSIYDIYSAINLGDKLLRLKSFNPYFFKKAARLRAYDSVEKYLSIAKNLKTDLFDFYNEDVLKEDLNNIYKKLTSKTGMFKSFDKDYKEAYNKILSYRNQKAKDEVVIDEVKRLIDYKRYYDTAQIYISDIEKFIGKIGEINLKDVLNDLHSLDTMPDMNISIEKYQSIKNAFKRVPQFSYFKPYVGNLTNVSKLFFKKDLDFFNDPIEFVCSRVVSIYENKENIFNYTELIKIVGQLNRFKAKEFLDLYISKPELPLDRMSNVYRKTFVKEKIDEIHSQSDKLSNFSSMSIDDIINEFRDLDERILHINRDFIISKNSVKRQDDLVEGSQFKLLDKEYNKLRRQLPIRTLLGKIFELALDIKPVFLMSPLSVSTYLNSQLNMFDCVIFDEASQIFACDAFGSIYRAKQCIVIGDTKQMPPTSFFQASVDTLQQNNQENPEEEIEEPEYDMESILDKASNTFETSSLKWHYRSRSEELIVFSNKSFYDSNLITIPTNKVHKEGFGIDFYYVSNGIYEGGTRTNPIEAQKICDMVFEHFDNSKESLGVVAFSNVQAELIQSLVEKRLKKEPKYEKYFSYDLDEPFFVKNLESVQGDERDRIIFSICYGYNSDGKFYQRFGPINAQGGERRLNVAITRAKYNISIVSSIKGDDIRDNPDSLGVTLLKQYLKFAENVVYEKNYSDSESGTIKSVTEYIESLGYEVVPNYGTSAFKVDLAIKKDDDYILAIMIDGSNSYSTNLTDNYRLERMLLERQGWRYYKLFTTAWINEEEQEKERIKKAIEGTLEEGMEYQPQPEAKSYLRVEGNDDVIDLDFTTYDYLENNRGKKILQQEGLEFLILEIVKVESPIHIEYLYKRVAKFMDKEKPDKELRANVDKNMPDRILRLGDFLFNFKISDIKLRLESDRDFDEIYIDELADGIYNIVNKNNGITEAGCFKTLANMLGFDKVTAQSKKLLLDALDHLITDRKIDERGESLFIIR